MIKTVNVIKEIKDKYAVPIYVFKFNPLFENKIQYLTGGDCGNNMIALFESDENGDIINEIPVILETDVDSIIDLFLDLKYTLIY